MCAAYVGAKRAFVTKNPLVGELYFKQQASERCARASARELRARSRARPVPFHCGRRRASERERFHFCLLVRGPSHSRPDGRTDALALSLSRSFRSRSRRGAERGKRGYYARTRSEGGRSTCTRASERRLKIQRTADGKTRSARTASCLKGRDYLGRFGNTSKTTAFLSPDYTACKVPSASERTCKWN